MSGRWLVTTMTLAVGGCFSGESTLGSICGDDLDCGAGQVCANEVCGRCGDAIPQRGELCSVSAAALSSAPVGAPGRILAFDLENDGNPDLVTRGAGGRPQFWTGDGRGGWSVTTELSAGGVQGPMQLAALDEDETVDLVVVDEAAPSVALGYGDGAGGWTFEPEVVLTESPLDLAVASAPWDGPGWVAWVDSAGLWQAAVEPESRTLAAPVMVVGARAQWLADPVPLDADEALDLAVADAEGQRVEPWFGDGAGGLSMGAPVLLEGRPIEIISFDADGDGDPDLLVPDEGQGVSVILSDGEGTLTVSERLMVPGVPRGVTIADLDRNVQRDVIVQVDGESPLWVFLGRGSRHIEGIALPVTEPVGAIVALDGDRDGLTELLLGPVSDAGPLQIVEVDP